MRDQTAPLEEAVRTLDEDKFNSRREYLAVKLAASLADRPFRVTDEQIKELRTEFDEAEIVEMMFCCAIFSWGNIVGIGLRVDLNDHSHYPALDWAAGEREKYEMTLEYADKLRAAEAEAADG